MRVKGNVDRVTFFNIDVRKVAAGFANMPIHTLLCPPPPYSSRPFFPSVPLFVSPRPCLSSGSCCVTALALCVRADGAPDTSKQLVFCHWAQSSSQE